MINIIQEFSPSEKPRNCSWTREFWVSVTNIILHCLIKIWRNSKRAKYPEFWCNFVYIEWCLETLMKWEVTMFLNPCPFTANFKTWTCRKGGDKIPPCVSKLRVVDLSGKAVDCSWRVPAIGYAFFFYPRSIFSPVLRGQRSDFREIDNFSTLH